MLDAKGYRTLNTKAPLLKERFDRWLEEEKVNIVDCKTMEYQPGKLRCIVYEKNEEGKRYMRGDEPATKAVIYYTSTEPPLGVFPPPEPEAEIE